MTITMKKPLFKHKKTCYNTGLRRNKLILNILKNT